MVSGGSSTVGRIFANLRIVLPNSGIERGPRPLGSSGPRGFPNPWRRVPRRGRGQRLTRPIFDRAVLTTAFRESQPIVLKEFTKAAPKRGLPYCGRGGS